MSTNCMNTRTIPKPMIAHYLPKNPVIVEAGAHIGRDTLKMSAAWPTCTIHAFEPVPELFQHLTCNVASNSRITCYPYALSNHTGTNTLFMSSGRSTATSSLYEPAEQQHPTTFFTPLTVQTITLDDWACNYGIEHVDGMWLDMQGAELLMLQAAPMILKTVSVIHTEVNFTQRYKNIPLYPEMKEWLMQCGFSVALEAQGNSDWTNVLFIR